MKNIFTIDVEDWYQTQDLNLPQEKWPQYEDRLEHGMGIILDILDTAGVKATFFVLGYIAKEYPELIKRIGAKGHEIGSHGYWHKMVSKQNPEEFREDLVLSKRILEDLTGQEVKYFRAPSWSISAKTLWALEILVEEGFTCDSSIQPFQTPLSGYQGAPEVPFYPVINGRKLNLLEVPPTVLHMGLLKIPFAGGLYLRVLPLRYILWALNKTNKERSAMVYIHPWELDIKQPRLPLPLHKRFTHYSNLANTQYKLERLLESGEFGAISEVIDEGIFPSLILK